MRARLYNLLFLLVFLCAPAAKSATFELDLKFPQNIREYKLAVATLKEGDIVKFKHGSFTLGKVLGRGQTTRIFALDESRAIRIPTDMVNREYICATIENYDVIENTELPAVRVLRDQSSPSCEFAVVERVPNLFTMEEFFHFLEVFHYIPANVRTTIEGFKKDQLLSEVENFFVSTFQFAGLDRDFGPRQVLWTGEKFILADWTYGFHWAESADDDRTVFDDDFAVQGVPKRFVGRYVTRIREKRQSAECARLLLGAPTPPQYVPTDWR